MRPCLVAIALFTLVPCLTAADDPEAVVKEYLKLTSDGMAILKSVKDEASAKAALPKLKALDEGLSVLDQFEITAALFAYQLQKDEFPKNLKALTEGENPILKAESLTDPWGNPCQYDAAGPKNKGEKPDVWTITPDKRAIGNWQDGNK